MQYALQRRHDEREGKAPPFIVMIMVRFLAASGASSLLDRTEREWRVAFGRKRSNAIALLAWSRWQVADLAEGGGWDAEIPATPGRCTASASRAGTSWTSPASRSSS